MATNFGIQYKGEVNFKVTSPIKKMRAGISPCVAILHEDSTSNKGDDLLFQSLVGFLIYGKNATQLLPQYIDMIPANSTSSMLNRRLRLTPRPAFEDGKQIAIFSATLSANNIPFQPNEGTPIQVNLCADVNGSQILAHTTWSYPKELEIGQSVLIEWRLSFTNATPTTDATEGSQL